MIRTIVTMVVTAIAGLVGHLVSDSFREKVAQRQRDKIADEVAKGDEAAVGRLKAAGVAAGRDAATTLIRTLVQLVYAVVRVAR